jgi:hypothetical protein
MNYIQHIRRSLAVLGALICGLLASAAVVPAAFARMLPDGGPPYGPAPAAPVPATTVRVITVGGMAGWQIALIAIGAALLAATVAVLVARTRPAHRKTISAAA